MSPSLSLSDLTSDQIEHYLAIQEDPIVGESSGRWVISRSNGDPGDQIWVVRLRGREGFEVLVPQTDWETLGDVEPQSQALFKYSAGFLPSLLTASDHSWQLVEETLDALREYLESSAWGERAAWMTSLDHAVAMRLRTMATLACRYRLSGVEVPLALLAIVERDVEEILRDPQRYLPRNNHGAMVCISLIHVSSIFALGSAGEAERTAWDALEQITADIFDESGVAGENSPAYQAYWLKLLEPLQAMVHAWPLTHNSSARRLLEVIPSAREALRFLTDSHGNLLPIGDSNANPSGVTPSGPGSLISESRGIYVYRSKDLLLTFRCGYSHYAHKHCDDTAITLSRHGVDLVVDAGFFGHDWRDPKVIYTKSQAGHSGLFFPELDDIHPGSLYRPDRLKIRSNMTARSEHGRIVEGAVEAESYGRLQRTVEVTDSADILLTDSFMGAGQSAVRRFLVPMDAVLKVDASHLRISRRGVWLEIWPASDQQPLEVEIVSGQVKPQMRGWIAPRPGELAACFSLEFPMPDGSEQGLILRTGGSSGGVDGA